ncbi:MAG: nicotinate (nicotinamide) nucleotide adenylyltransferase [Luteolibacter sp.]
MPSATAAPEKIALFGGTFDPVHLGHIHLARTAVEALGLDQVRFLPCRISPHKLGSHPTPAADRLEMLQLATTELPWAVVDDFETRIEGPSFSYRTAEEMAARFPQARLFWIMGGDQWAALDQWAEPRRLAKCVEFIVFTRGEPLAAREGCRSHPLAVFHPASATIIREALAEGAGGHEWLDPAVARWIREHGLYRGGQ